MIYPLKGKVQHYAWGGMQFIPQLLHIENKLSQPFAEYWLGAHPSAPSSIFYNNSFHNLKQLIDDTPTLVLGEEVYNTFKELPYLLKILDVKNPLSIQVHPTKHQAEVGYEAENLAGVPILASNRNYKDNNHKPEIMVALSDFWLLHGFKQLNEIEQILIEYKELSILLALFKNEGIKGLYQFIMEIEQTEIDHLLIPLIKKELRQMREHQLHKNMPGWWVAKLYENICEFNHIDRGIFSFYLFNIVHLQKGDAIFQAAGIPHAYLEGQNVELMANSDNVLRGGLTSKHIDVPELIKLTLFEGITPVILKGQKLLNETFYSCPVNDFVISKIDLTQGEHYETITSSVEVLIVTEGAIIVKGQENSLFKQGDALIAFACTEYVITASGNTTVFKASIPFEQNN